MSARTLTDAERIEHLEVQLAGCACAAKGLGRAAEEGDYGWSPAYQDVVDLRLEVERLRKRVARMEAEG